MRLLIFLLALLLSACAPVSTQVLQLDPTLKLAPTQQVEILFEPPTRPYTEIALIESQGQIGVGEVELLSDAREKAKALGADAILRVDVQQIYQPPVAMYDPLYDPWYWHGYRYRALPPYPHPWGAYRIVGGGYSQTLKAVAIKYQEVAKN